MSKTQSTRWHYIYYVLAAVDILTIGLSLFLNHQILSIYTESIHTNSIWVKRSELYDNLSYRASLVNAPGNDVFDSLDVNLERNKKKEALEAYQLVLQNARDELKTIQKNETQEKLVAQLTKIETSMNAMDKEAELIFGFFERGDAKKAGTRMATMDRKFAVLNVELSELRKMVRDFQKEDLHQDEKSARQLGKFEYPLAGSILVIVCIVAIYGHWMSFKINSANILILQQQASLESSARLASLGTMSAGIAHEINNPLAIIQGNAQLVRNRLKKGNVSPEVWEKSIEKIISTCYRITAIVKGLRSFARDGTKDPFALVSVKQLLDDSVAFCQERFKNNNVELRIQILSDIDVECRQVQICQVIVNLLNNAFDAVVKKESPWVKVSASVQNKTLLLRVTDSGNGIPKEIQDKMMTPFFTTKEVGKGTGLGLSISHGVALQHGGRLFIDNNMPNTSLVLEIPLSQTGVREEKMVA